MAKDKEQKRQAEEFIQSILSKYFNQKVSKKSARVAAAKLVASIPNTTASSNDTPKKAA